MLHSHNVFDSDTHFTIDTTTRLIKNTSLKTSIVQFDHNSERFTFELPRYIEGHDISLCNKVEVHYNNMDPITKKENVGVYEVDDLGLTDDTTSVMFSWLISANATQLGGILTFLVRFACLTDDVIDYAWHTDIHSGIVVTNGMNNGEAILLECADAIEQWKRKLIAQETGDDKTVVMSQKAACSSFANALKGGLSGTEVTVDDVSSINKEADLIFDISNFSISQFNWTDFRTFNKTTGELVVTSDSDMVPAITDFLEVTGTVKFVENPAQTYSSAIVNIACFDENQNYLGYVDIMGSNHRWDNNPTPTLIEGTKYIRIEASGDAGYYGESWGIVIKNVTISGVKIDISIPYRIASPNAFNGETETETLYGYLVSVTTKDFIPVSANTSIKLHAEASYGNGINIYCYDANKVQIGTYGLGDFVNRTIGYSELSADTAYIKVNYSWEDGLGSGVLHELNVYEASEGTATAEDNHRVHVTLYYPQSTITADMNMTVEYIRDSNTVINDLETRIAALEAAILNS